MHLTGQCNSVPRVCVCVCVCVCVWQQRNCCIRLCSGVLAIERVWGHECEKEYVWGALCQDMIVSMWVVGILKVKYMQRCPVCVCV